MFKKIFTSSNEEVSLEKDNKNLEIIDHFKYFDNPSISRKDTLYYVEMQQLAFNLVRYLKTSNKNTLQGNWNFTYLTENMSREDFILIARKFLGRMNATEWKEMIKSSSFSDDKHGMLQLVDDNIKSHSVYKITYKPKLQDEQITYVDKPDLYKALAELEKRFELEKLEYKLYG